MNHSNQQHDRRQKVEPVAISQLAAVGIAVALFVLWAVTTYLFEGRILTLQRPEAFSARILYTIVANLFIGTIGAIMIVRTFIRSYSSSSLTFGFSSPGRTVVSIFIATIIGVSFLFIQRPPSWNPIILMNGFAQTLVVSIAEVLVCWAVLGASIASFYIFENKISSITLGLIASAVAYHDLRHTFCSNLILSGSDLKDVKEMIGHSDLAMTDRYSHLTNRHKQIRQDELARYYQNGMWYNVV